jgi:lauroyl/myristoyl acyltransferase
MNPSHSRAASAKGAADALISRNDLILALQLPALALLAWSIPYSLKPGFSRLHAKCAAWLRPSGAHRAAGEYAAPFAPPDPVAFFIAVQSELHLERLNLLALHAPFRTPPQTRLIGAEHLRDALKTGHGALLWTVAGAHSRTETKLSLWREGFRAHHLSRSFHGFSRTRFGKTFLNPIRTRIEARYLASRVVIRDGQTGEALAELARLLKENEIVSITMGTEARRVASTPFLAGRLNVATRPIALACETGARLLPVITTRGDDGVFTTEIGAALTLPKDPACDQETAKALEELADFLKPRVSAHPAQFARAEIIGKAETA